MKTAESSLLAATGASARRGSAIRGWPSHNHSCIAAPTTAKFMAADTVTLGRPVYHQSSRNGTARSAAVIIRTRLRSA